MSELLNYAKTLAHQIAETRRERDLVKGSIAEMIEDKKACTFEFSLLEHKLDWLNGDLVYLAFEYEEARALLAEN